MATAMTPKTKLAPNDAKRMAKIRNRVREVYRTNGEDIKAGRFLHMAADVFKEMKFMVELIDGVKSKPEEGDVPPSKKKGKKTLEDELNDLDTEDVEEEEEEAA